MRVRAKILQVFMGICLFSLLFATVALAAPSEPIRVVNHITKECGEMATGDECVICEPAEGWEVLVGECPRGYTELKNFAPASCRYSGDTISMCDYAKEKYEPKNSNTTVFISGFVIAGILLFTVLRKLKSARKSE